MALTIKDGAGSTTSLKTTLTGSDHMPHHIVQAVSGTVTVTSSLASPVYVTGAVSSVSTISGPVTASISNTALDPVYLTGTIYVADTENVDNNLALLVKVTGSNNDPIKITGSIDTGFSGYFVDGKLAMIVKITGSSNDYTNVSASKNNPVFVVSDSDKPVYVANQSSNALFVTSSASFPLQVQNRPISFVTKQKYIANEFGFDWSINSGTLVLATEDTGRKSLIISNPSPHELYISVGSGALNGFQIDLLTIPPETYSFIIYPSGTYTADEYAASAFHAAFFISQSDNSSLKALVTKIGY